MNKQAPTTQTTITDPPTAEPTTALASIDEGGFKALAMLDGGPSLADILHKNLGIAGLTFNDFKAADFPAGGGTFWTVPNMDAPNGVEAMNELCGIIVLAQDTRRFYREKKGAGEENIPPNCWSPDGISGYGDPGGLCERCPMDKWNSDTGGGRGKACKQRKQLLLLPRDERLPLAIDLPPASLSTFKSYAMNLSSQGMFLCQCETGISLKKMEKGGNTYAVAQFRRVCVLGAEDAVAAAAYADAMEKIVMLQAGDDTAPMVSERTELSEPPAGLSTAPVDAEDPFGANE